MKTKYDLLQDENHYGWVVDKRYDWINMLTKMEKNKKILEKELEKHLLH